MSQNKNAFISPKPIKNNFIDLTTPTSDSETNLEPSNNWHKSVWYKKKNGKTKNH